MSTRPARATRTSPRPVAIVTGASHGLGRAYARALGAAGYAVVVNSRGGSEVVVEEIEAAGGSALAADLDITDFDGVGDLVESVVERLGGLDVVVANAGFVRDRMLASMTEADWDEVIGVHLKGTFAIARHAARYWRERAKAAHPVDARLITTTSASGLYGNVGQSNYGAAKAGVAAFTRIVARELAPYGVSANCLSPGARTRMSEPVLAAMGQAGADWGAQLDPEWVAEVVVWLCRPDAADVTGQVIDVRGQELAIADGWHLPRIYRRDGRQLGSVLREALAAAAPPTGIDGLRRLATAGA